MDKFSGTASRRLVIILVFLLLIIGVILGYFLKEKIKYNHQLDLGPFDKLYMYQFEEGIGFTEKKVNNSQKEAIIQLIRDLKPCEEVKKYNEYTAAGGYFSFYFKKNNIRTVFFLKEIVGDVLLVTASEVDADGKIISQSYFTSQVELAERIEDVIINTGE